MPYLHVRIDFPFHNHAGAVVWVQAPRISTMPGLKKGKKKGEDDAEPEASASDDSSGVIWPWDYVASV